MELILLSYSFSARIRGILQHLFATVVWLLALHYVLYGLFKGIYTGLYGCTFARHTIYQNDEGMGFLYSPAYAFNWHTPPVFRPRRRAIT